MSTFKPSKAGFLGTHFRKDANRIITEHLGDSAFIGKQCIRGIFSRKYSKLQPLGRLGVPTSTITFCFNHCDYPNVSCGTVITYCGQDFTVKEIENNYCGIICLTLQICDSCN